MTFPAPSSGPLLVRDPDVASWLGAALAAGWAPPVPAPVPEEPWDLTGVLVLARDGRDAALVLARGGAAVCRLEDPAVGDASALLYDAWRLAADVWPGDGAVEATAPVPDDPTDALLAALVEGASVGAAARRANMSLRTAQRRLDGLRRHYGVTTTAGVVASWTRERSASGPVGNRPVPDGQGAGR